jgi:hypothetical protein
MRRALTVLGLTSMLAAAAAVFVALPNAMSRAGGPDKDSTFIISANDGYGLGDCLASGNDCGKIVANAWCTAQGFGRAVAFGLADPEDVTGSTEPKLSEADRPISITCAN